MLEPLIIDEVKYDIVCRISLTFPFIIGWLSGNPEILSGFQFLKTRDISSLVLFTSNLRYMTKFTRLTQTLLSIWVLVLKQILSYLELSNENKTSKLKCNFYFLSCCHYILDKNQNLGTVIPLGSWTTFKIPVCQNNLHLPTKDDEF